MTAAVIAKGILFSPSRTCMERDGGIAMRCLRLIENALAIVPAFS